MRRFFRKKFDLHTGYFSENKPSDQYVDNIKQFLQESPIFTERIEASPVNVFYLAALVDYQSMLGQNEGVRQLKSTIGNKHYFKLREIMKVFTNISKSKLKFFMNYPEIFAFFDAFIKEGIDFAKDKYNDATFKDGLASLLNYCNIATDLYF